MAVEDTLMERGNRYGDFADHALIAQKLQDVMRMTYDVGWDKLNVVQKQALTVIADKIARILSGDPNYVDNWHDIQGYARLVEERLDPNFDFSVAMGQNPAPDKPGGVKVVKSCCKHPYPNPQRLGLKPPMTYCINCGHQYKPGDIQYVGTPT